MAKFWDFANANGSITLTAKQARELFDHISRDVHTGEKRLNQYFLDDLDKAIKKALRSLNIKRHAGN